MDATGYSTDLGLNYFRSLQRKSTVTKYC